MFSRWSKALGETCVRVDISIKKHVWLFLSLKVLPVSSQSTFCNSVPWPSSHFSLNVPQCLLPLLHLKFLNQSTIVCNFQHLLFFSDTHACVVNESHVHSLSFDSHRCYSLSLSLAAATHSHMEGIIVMTHSLTPVPGSSTERQWKHSLRTMPVHVCVWVWV